MEIKNYNKEFTERTKKLLDEYYDKIEQEKGYEFTFLMNCLLGLVVVIKENYDDSDEKFQKFLDKKLNEIEELKYIFPKEKKNLSLSEFLRLLRNGIAHQNVEPTNERGIWERVNFYNISGKGKRNFEVVFTQEELRKFALFLANKYLELNK